MSETPDLKGEPEADAKQRLEGHSTAGTPGNSSESATDPDFVVSEAHEQSPEMVGGYTPEPKPDDLGTVSPADLMDSAARQSHSAPPAAFDISDNDLIGDSQPPNPQPVDDYEETTAGENDFGAIKSNIEPPDEPGRIEKLSDEKLLEISARMQAETDNAGYLTEEEKYRLLHSIDEAAPQKGFDNQPIVPPKRKAKAAAPDEPVELTGEKPQIAKRVRGVAYFASGFIQVKGEQELHDMDELTINGREYVLRKKRFSTKTILLVVAPLAAILLFVLGTMFSTGADTGQGRIVGMVLDEYDQPMIAGASISLPDLGQRYEVNGQGFFKTEQIPAGSYRVDYYAAGVLTGTDYATVADGELTTFAIRPAPPTPEPTQPTASTSAPVSVATTPSAPPPPAPSAPARTESKPSKKQTTTAKASSKPTEEWARITLVADIDGAKLTVDNKVVGVGNLTYPKIAPGNHTYLVSKDGYEPAEGKVRLTAGEDHRLSVSLKRLARKETNKPPDSYVDGVNALLSGDYETAVARLDEAIRENPRHTDAYFKRAEALVALYRRTDASNDYTRAGRLLNAAGHIPEAVAAYDKAIDLDSKSVEGYLGRGGIYLERGEAIAAIADFDMVVRLDKRNVGGYMGLGEARYQQGYFSKATKHFKDARSIEPENPTIYQALMLSYLGEGDLKQVKKCYEKFLELASNEQAQQLGKDPKYAAALEAIED